MATGALSLSKRPRPLAGAEDLDPGGDYVSLERAWTDRRQQDRAQIRGQLVLIAMLSTGLVALAGAVLWLAVFRAPTPYVLKVDEVSGVSFGGFLDTDLSVTDELIPSQIMDFVERWRTVTPDNTMQKRLVTRLYCMVSARAPARERLNGYFRDDANNPFERNENLSVSTEIRQVSKLAGATWQVEWYETTRAHDGLVVGERQTFKATLIVEKGAIDATCLEGNPLGLYVQELSWTRAR